MNNNNDTISKLSEALTTLISAYEELQKECDTLESAKKELEEKNKNLESEIIDLKSSKDALQNEKNDLEIKLSEVNSHNEVAGTNINSMLSKIETILKKKQDDNDEDKKDFNTASPSNQSSTPNVATDSSKYASLRIGEDSKIDDDEFETTPIMKEPLKRDRPESVSVNDLQLDSVKKDDKIDLSRMASLLNGFNK